MMKNMKRELIEQTVSGAGKTDMHTTIKSASGQTNNNKRAARWLRSLLLPLIIGFSLTAQAATAPGAPTTVTAVAGNAQATVSFKAPTSNGGSAITGYTVTSSPAGGVDSNAGTTGLSHIVTGLTNGTAYKFTVKATNAIGTSVASTASASVTPATVPGIPTIGTATGGNAKATITFTPPASNGGSAITSYTATSTPGSKTGTCTASPCSVTGLTNGTAYTFTIKATNAKGTGTASAASNSTTPATVPGAPTGLTATGGNAQASVAFTAPASNGGAAITSYKATSTPGSLTGTCTTSPCTVTGLTNGTAYTFKVTATNTAGTGTASAASNSVTPAATVPGAPTNVTATGGNAQATVIFVAPASNGGSAITGYTVTSLPAGGTDSNAGTTGLSHLVTGLTNGTAYTFTVKATNAKGSSVASTASNSVTPIAPVPPTVSLTSPAANTVAIAPANFTLSANASSTTSTIAKVEFYNGTTLLQTLTAAPYSYIWSNVAAGGYSLTAKATDALGAATTSTAVVVISDAPPTVSLTSPAQGAQITSPNSFTLSANAASTTSTIAKVEFYNGTTLLGTATAAPYSYTWNSVPVGSYSLTAKATDALGTATTTAAINVTAVADQPPAVSIVTPANGSTAKALGSFTLTATASSSTSSIAKVDYYANNGTTNTLIGTASTAPYTYAWSNVALGTYAITAVATDALNTTTTSNPVSVTVNNGEAQAYYIHADHLDTPRTITDSNGNVVWTWENLDPFGNNAANENPSGLGQFIFNLRFPGQYMDKETNLYYNVNRTYDPSTGRYVESDPIGLAGDSFSTYAYVGGDPLRNIDPLGELWEQPNQPWDFPSKDWQPPGRCETEGECWEKAQKNILKCGVKRSCQMYWRWYQTQCPGKVADPSCKDCANKPE